FENMVSGIQSMTLPIMLYLLTMCFSALLEHEAMGEFFNGAVRLLGPVSFLVPAVLFLVSTLVTVSLGSSWAMYVIGIPVALHMAANMGLSVPLCVGAVASAGIAGEKNCAFTSDALSVANAIGCDPDVILKVRLKYSVIFSAVALLMYVAAGLIF
ncbi:MAG: hypothetical protein II794_05865, partial [Oscillospiraceae bacterium]|nr:hypothetical protein [Oscillospiraceae bacterium]